MAVNRAMNDSRDMLRAIRLTFVAPPLGARCLRQPKPFEYGIDVSQLASRIEQRLQRLR